MTRRVPILYRWWDADGNLLYIGKSISLFARIESHRQRSSFFEEAASMTMERYPDEITLGLAEVEAIRAARPPYNVAHNREVNAPSGTDLTPAMLGALAGYMAPIFEAVQSRSRRAS